MALPDELRDIALFKSAYVNPLPTLIKEIAKHRERMASIELSCEKEIAEIIENYRIFSSMQECEYEAHKARLKIISEALDLARRLADPVILREAIGALRYEMEQRPRFLLNLRDLRQSHS